MQPDGESAGRRGRVRHGSPLIDSYARLLPGRHIGRPLRECVGVAMKYDDEARNAALDCLAANEGDYRATSASTGISVGTLRRWARQARGPTRGEELTQLRAELVAFKAQAGAQQGTSDLAEDKALGWMHDRLLPRLIDDALQLSESIEAVIDDAPLNQRASALNQILDKVLKLLDILPRNEEPVLRVEFVDPDGTTHETPFWSRKDSDE